MSNSLIIIAVLLVISLYLASVFNNLVRLKNQFKNAFSQISVQLKRRYDLIPNLVETAKGYLKHERETLENVIKARNSAASALSQAATHIGQESAMQNLSQAEGAFKESIGKLNVLMEAYPDLKSNQNMMQLSEELASTENKIAFARQSYNDQVMYYNAYKQSFPQNILAPLFGHGADASALEFADEEKMQNPTKISF